MIELIACSFSDPVFAEQTQLREQYGLYCNVFVILSAVYHGVLLFRQHIYTWHLIVAVALIFVPFLIPFECDRVKYFAFSATAATISASLLIYAWTNMAKERRLLAVHPELFKP